MTALGTSFTRWRAEALGLDYRSAFAELCQMGFSLIRLSASWQEIVASGWEHLDWLMANAADVGQPILLTVGMKALGWPEFYLPVGLDPAQAAVQHAAIAHIERIVRRFVRHPTLRAWQIENEPFNRSGPDRRWIPRPVVRREARAARSLDAERPLVVTCFAHFDAGLDRASSRHEPGWKERLGLDIAAEREALSILRPGDVLGLDVYRKIGWVDETGGPRVARAAPDQLANVRRWQRIAREQGKRLWITEAQAEPWEARRDTHGNPLTVQPDDVSKLIEDLTALDIDTILLWGSEYWLWRERQGDARWIDAVGLACRALA